MPQATTTTATPSGAAPTTRRVTVGAFLALAANAKAGALPMPGPHPDGELLALCDTLAAHEAETEAMEAPWMEVIGGPPDDVFAVMQARADECHALVDRIYRIPASTPEGLRAKAKAAWPRLCTYADGSPDLDGRLAWSVMRDLLRASGDLPGSDAA